MTQPPPLPPGGQITQDEPDVSTARSACPDCHEGITVPLTMALADVRDQPAVPVRSDAPARVWHTVNLDGFHGLWLEALKAHAEKSGTPHPVVEMLTRGNTGAADSPRVGDRVLYSDTTSGYRRNLPATVTVVERRAHDGSLDTDGTWHCTLTVAHPQGGTMLAREVPHDPTGADGTYRYPEERS